MALFFSLRPREAPLVAEIRDVGGSTMQRKMSYSFHRVSYFNAGLRWCWKKGRARRSRKFNSCKAQELDPCSCHHGFPRSL